MQQCEHILLAKTVIILQQILESISGVDEAHIFHTKIHFVSVRPLRKVRGFFFRVFLLDEEKQTHTRDRKSNWDMSWLR